MEVWIPGGVFCNFGFGLREKVGSLDSGGGYSATSVLDLGKKLEVWILGGGILQLRFWTKGKSWNFGFWGGGVFCNFRFGLREKVGSLDSGGGYSATSVLDLGKKLEVWIPGGVFCNFGFGLREKVGSLDFGGGGGIL